MDWLFLKHTKVPSVRIGERNNSLSYSSRKYSVATAGTSPQRNQSAMKQAQKSFRQYYNVKNFSQISSTAGGNSSTMMNSNSPSPRCARSLKQSIPIQSYLFESNLISEKIKEQQELQQFYESIIPFDNLKTNSEFVKGIYI